MWKVIKQVLAVVRNGVRAAMEFGEGVMMAIDDQVERAWRAVMGTLAALSGAPPAPRLPDKADFAADQNAVAAASDISWELNNSKSDRDEVMQRIRAREREERLDLGQRIHAYASANPEARALFDFSSMPDHVARAVITMQPDQLRMLADAGPVKAARWAEGRPGVVEIAPPLKGMVDLEPKGSKRKRERVDEPAPDMVMAA